jgi:hypothetical protein
MRAPYVSGRSLGANPLSLVLGTIGSECSSMLRVLEPSILVVEVGIHFFSNDVGNVGIHVGHLFVHVLGIH